MKAGERQRDVEPLLAFVDAIVAIAITLLIPPLVELAPDVHDSGDLAGLLPERSGELWSFWLGFYVIARFWPSQHDAVRPLLLGGPAADRPLAGVVDPDRGVAAPDRTGGDGGSSGDDRRALPRCCWFPQPATCP